MSRTSGRKRANEFAARSKTLGYSVNHQARALASGSGTQIMLIYAHNPEREPNSFYNAGLELGALRAVRRWGLTSSPAQSIRKGSILRAFSPRSSSMSAPPDCPFPAVVGRSRPWSGCAQRAGIKMVAISAGDRARPIVSTVGIDDRAAGRSDRAASRELGHRRLGFIKGPPDHQSAGASLRRLPRCAPRRRDQRRAMDRNGRFYVPFGGRGGRAAAARARIR